MIQIIVVSSKITDAEGVRKLLGTNARFTDEYSIRPFCSRREALRHIQNSEVPRSNVYPYSSSSRSAEKDSWILILLEHRYTPCSIDHLIEAASIGHESVKGGGKFCSHFLKGAFFCDDPLEGVFSCNDPHECEEELSVDEMVELVQEVARQRLLCTVIQSASKIVVGQHLRDPRDCLFFEGDLFTSSENRAIVSGALNDAFSRQRPAQRDTSVSLST